MIDVPALETARLVLRGWREDDLDALARMLGDSEVTKFVGGAQSRADAWRSMAGFVGHWALRGYGLWAVTRKSDGAFVGRVGIHYPVGWPGSEIAWTLDKPYWGQGYATEAATASLRFGFERLGLDRLVSLIDPENRSSQRVAERIGETRGGPTTVTVFGRTVQVELWSVTQPN